MSGLAIEMGCDAEDIDAFLGKVDDLMEAAYKNKDDIREMVKEIVGTYKPAK